MTLKSTFEIRHRAGMVRVAQLTDQARWLTLAEATELKEALQYHIARAATEYINHDQ
jgi:hypothetical protein